MQGTIVWYEWGNDIHMVLQDTNGSNSDHTLCGIKLPTVAHSVERPDNTALSGDGDDGKVCARCLAKAKREGLTF